MKYDESIVVAATSNVTGSNFIPWQPSTWPDINDDREINRVIEDIFYQTIIGELENVINDIMNSSNDGLQHRGHVIAIPMLCAIDVMSLYIIPGDLSESCPLCGRGDRVGPRYKEFIKKYFPEEYKQFAGDLYKLYRCSLVHRWHLFNVAIYPDDRLIAKKNNTVELGLLNFMEAIKYAYESVLSELKKSQNNELRKYVINIYNKLKSEAKV